ncbi:GntR family transcriptional regulator [Corynebacterium qintianiae]|uniref:GntR family transcriptional regulator n=1 Tax=Corynebacterium qintianiae TaxID=2709392 RepID=A0A7T0KLC0_9CORY|nr:GntR family transcriptional regulator [Corynebacterium qintianiae]QPK82881.1 GntR family transcriptional regulator [Corynebacterium qintianiae]
MARKPTYVVIAEELRRRIEARELKSGDRLPPERELVEEFGVARMTVRHALDLLQAEGMIDRRRGRAGGTFARALPPVVNLCGERGLLAQLEDHGVAVRSEEIYAGERIPPRIAAVAFGLGEESAVAAREYLHYADGAPAFFETVFVRPAREDCVAGSSLRCESMEGEHGCEDIITPSVASDAERGHLQLSVSTPLQRVARQVLVGQDTVAFATIVLRPDAALLRVAS